MKLVTIQTKSAYDKLVSQGYLITDTSFVNTQKYGVPYRYIVENMKGISNTYSADYPLWAWVQYGKFTSPPKNKLLGFFPKEDDIVVRITFEKRDEDVLVSDYVKYHFLLTNEYLPIDIADKNRFEKDMIDRSVSKEDLMAYVRRDKYDSFRLDDDFNTINSRIRDSHKRIFSPLGEYRQGTVWSIEKNEVKKVEFIYKKDCTKKSSVDYRELYIKGLK